MRARRARHLFFRIADDLLPDIARLLRGEVELVRQTRLLAVSILTGQEREISPEELELLEALSLEVWTDDAQVRIGSRVVRPDELRRLAEAGLVVLDDDEGPLAELRHRDERLAETGWDPYAALFHSQSRWRDINLGVAVEGRPVERASGSAPPPAFHVRPDALETIELPVGMPEDGFFRLLGNRRTSRSFDTSAPLTRDELAVLVQSTFGCQGLADLGDGIVLQRRTSPSGGSLHPVEVYALVVDVEGVPAGVHHYRTDRHALELLTPLEAASARELLVEFAAGQHYLSTASVLLILTVRFGRSFWKYRSNARAYAVVLMDVAHLSQTFYLVCGELGLGAFVSAAVNTANVEDALGLDGLEEGVVAVCGCGRPTGERSPFDLEFEPYVPRSS